MPITIPAISPPERPDPPLGLGFFVPVGPTVVVEDNVTMTSEGGAVEETKAGCGVSRWRYGFRGLWGANL